MDDGRPFRQPGFVSSGEFTEPKCLIGNSHPAQDSGWDTIVLVGREVLRPDLPRSAHQVMKAGELLRTDRATGVHLAGGDADLRAETELAAVGELGRGVPDHDRAVDPVQEIFGRRGILGDDRLGMAGAVSLDMVDRRVRAFESSSVAGLIAA